MKNHSLPLPVELMREILLRLPVRSVLRFKCVCKSWLSLISDPQFGISHYDLAAAPSHRLLLIANDFYAESIDIDAPLNKDSAVVHFPLPPTSPPYRDEYDDADYRDKHEILGSCKGLIVLYFERSSDLFVWNPSIGVHKLFSKDVYGLTRIFLYGFGYDTSSDDYLLILIGLHDYTNYEPEDDEFEDDEYKARYRIFSFKTVSWDMDDIFVSYKVLGDNFRAGSLFNETLHWLVLSEDKRVPVILAFDLIQRSFSEIPLFDHLTMKKYEVYCVSVMGGCLSVCCSVRGSATDEIWVMKEYKVESSWTKSFVIPTNGFSPKCITKEGGIIGSNICGRLEKFNDKGELLEHFIYGGGQWLHSANLQSALYRESLLSLPTVIRATREYDFGETSEDDHGETSEDDQ